MNLTAEVEVGRVCLHRAEPYRGKSGNVSQVKNSNTRAQQTHQKKKKEKMRHQRERAKYRMIMANMTPKPMSTIPTAVLRSERGSATGPRLVSVQVLTRKVALQGGRGNVQVSV